MIPALIERFSIGAGINLPSAFGESGDKVDINAGVDYTTESFSFPFLFHPDISSNYIYREIFVFNSGISYTWDFLYAFMTNRGHKISLCIILADSVIFL